MPLLIIQLALLIAVAFVIGAVLGRIIRGKNKDKADTDRMIVAAALSEPAGDEKPEAVAPAAGKEKPLASPAASKKPAAEKAIIRETVSVPDAEPVGDWEIKTSLLEETTVSEADQPLLLDGPRDGKADDLTTVNGIGQGVQTLLNNLGIYHYDQIAGWSVEEAGWIERNIGFPRRVSRESWIGQAVKLSQAQKKTALKSKAKTRKTPTKSRTKTVKKTDS